MPYVSTIDNKQESDELRRDMRTNLGDRILGPATVSHSETLSYGWTVQGDMQISNFFGPINISLGGNYSQQRSFTDTYTFPVDSGRTAQVIHVPYMHHVRGYITITDYVCIPRDKNNLVQGDLTDGILDICPLGSFPVEHGKPVDHVWSDLFFPLGSGQFQLQYLDCIFYEDHDYGGRSWVLPSGDHDYGDNFANDAISSLKVPYGFKVTLFEDSHFRGRSKFFYAGDYRYVGNDFNDKTSSIKVEIVSPI